MLIINNKHKLSFVGFSLTCQSLAVCLTELERDRQLEAERLAGHVIRYWRKRRRLFQHIQRCVIQYAVG